MNINLLPNWQTVLTKSASIKANLVALVGAAVLATLQYSSPDFDAKWTDPKNLLTIGIFLASLSAGILRLVNQGIGVTVSAPDDAMSQVQ